MAIPALSRNYWSRMNVPFMNTSSPLHIESFWAWGLVHVLTNQLTTGSVGGVRHANSIWICRGSSDGLGVGAAVTSVGVAGTNRWWNAGVYPIAGLPNGLTRGGSGSNHNWILLENVTLGYELLVIMSPNPSYITMSIGKSGCFSGGSGTAHPAPSDPTACVQLIQTAYATSDGGQAYGLFGDSANTGFTNYLHMTVADNGEFWAAQSRAGGTGFSGFMAVWRTTGQNVLDTWNTFILQGQTSTNIGRGTLIAAHVNYTAFAASRQPNLAQKTYGSVILPWSGGYSYVMTAGGDAFTGVIDVAPMEIGELSPMRIRRGFLPDAYMIGLETVGAPLPIPGAGQTHIVIGDTVWPCVAVQPII